MAGQSQFQYLNRKLSAVVYNSNNSNLNVGSTDYAEEFMEINAVNPAAEPTNAPFGRIPSYSPAISYDVKIYLNKSSSLIGEYEAQVRSGASVGTFTVYYDNPNIPPKTLEGGFISEMPSTTADGKKYDYAYTIVGNDTAVNEDV